MLEEYEIPYYGVDERWEISDNRYLVNLMISQAEEIEEIFEKFLEAKGIRISFEKQFSEGDYFSLQEELMDALETLLHQARNEFEDDAVD